MGVREQCLNPGAGGSRRPLLRVPGARRQRGVAKPESAGAETAAGVRARQARRRDPGWHGLAAGAGGRGDCGWSPGGRRESSYMLQGTEMAGVGGAAKLTAPSHQARGSPSQAARSSRAGGPQNHKLGWRCSSPRAPRNAAGGAARASGRGSGACPGQPRDAAARGPPRPCTARAQTEPRGREPGLWELLSRRGRSSSEFRRRRRRLPSLGPAPGPLLSPRPLPAGFSGNDVPPRAWRLPGNEVKQSGPREERGESGGG